MEQNPKNIDRKDVQIGTQSNQKTQAELKRQIVLPKNDQSKIKVLVSSVQSTKQHEEIVKQYEKKLSSMTQTISKLTKRNEQQREQFRLMNDKLNKAFSKLTANKLKQPEKQAQQVVILGQQLQKVRRQLQNEMKKNKFLKKDLQILKQTQNLLNNQDKFVEIKNQLVDRQRQIKELKDKLRGYQKAEENQKKMTYYRKQEELNKKLNQLNEENIYMKKKVTEMKAKIEEMQKQKHMEKAQLAVQKNIKSMGAKKTNENSSQFIKKQIYEEDIKKLEFQIKTYENQKSSLQKQHKIQTETLKKQNIILNQEIQELKNEIKRKNKQKNILEHRKNAVSEMKKSRIERNSLTIELGDDKNERYRTFSPSIKAQNETFGSLRKQFLGLSYGNYGNDYKKHDDSLKLDESRNYKISSMTFSYFEQHILSLKVKYKYINGEEVQIETFNLEHSYSNIKTAEIIFQDHQYIKQLDIYCGKMVELIHIKTSRNQLFEVGNQKNQIKCKKYSFDIRNHEKPISFGCITEVKKINEVKKQFLVVFGLILKKKDISIAKKRHFQTPKISLKQKLPPATQRASLDISQSVQKQTKNDKNPQISKKVKKN